MEKLNSRKVAFFKNLIFALYGANPKKECSRNRYIHAICPGALGFLPVISNVFSEAATRSSLNNHWGCVCAKNGFFKFMATLCCKKGRHILSWLWMETYTLAPLLLCLKGFPSRLLRLSKYVVELWVFTAGSSPLYETKPPPIDTQARSGTERLVSEKENVSVIRYQIYFNKLRYRRPGKRDSTPGKGR